MSITEQTLTFLRYNPPGVPIAAAFEASGPHPLRDELLAVQLIGQQGSTCRLDLTLGGQEMEVAKGMLATYPLVLFDAARCLVWLSGLGVRPAVAEDPKLASYVLNPNQSLDLCSVVRGHLGEELPVFSKEPLQSGVLCQAPDELLPLPTVEVATAIHRLFEKLRDLPDWAEAIYGQELALASVVAGMELRGIHADKSLLRGKVKELEGQAANLEAKLDSIVRESGWE